MATSCCSAPGGTTCGATTCEKTQDQAIADNNEFNSGGPGISPEVCDHLAERKIAMLGADNWGIEPYDFAGKGQWPTPFADVTDWAYCHMNLSVRRGIYLFENLDLRIWVNADRVKCCSRGHRSNSSARPAHRVIRSRPGSRKTDTPARRPLAASLVREHLSKS